MIVSRIIRYILKWLRGAFLDVVEWLRKHLIEAIVAALMAAGFGAINAHTAKKIDAEAMELQSAALEKYDRANELAQWALSELGEAEGRAFDSLERFADAIERIQGRPRFKVNAFAPVRLPNYEPSEMKRLSADFKMAIGGAGGAGAGALAGLAAYGAAAAVAAPAMIGAGLVLCVKGIGLRKRAVENKRQAQEMMRNVDEIVGYLDELRTAAERHRASLNTVFSKHAEYLARVEAILVTKSSWNEFNRMEKRAVEDSVMLARLLYEMAKLNLVVNLGGDGELEKVNSAELEKVRGQAEKLLRAVC